MRKSDEVYIIDGETIWIRQPSVGDFGEYIEITERSKNTVYIHHYDNGYSTNYIATKKELKKIKKMLEKGFDWFDILDVMLEDEM